MGNCRVSSWGYWVWFSLIRSCLIWTLRIGWGWLSIGVWYRIRSWIWASLILVGTSLVRLLWWQ